MLYNLAVPLDEPPDTFSLTKQCWIWGKYVLINSPRLVRNMSRIEMTGSY